MVVLRSLLIAGCIVGVLSPPVWARQQALPGHDEAAIEAALTRVMRAYEAGAYRQAEEEAAHVFRQHAGAYAEETGSAAYWLGLARLAQGRGEAATEVWEEGLQVLKAVGVFDVRLADAFVRSIFASGIAAKYEMATAAYLDLLASLDWKMQPDERAVAARHLAALAFILPERIQAEVGLGQEPGEPGQGGLETGAGLRLVQWWRSRDEFPATPLNERLAEHLERVAYADRHYQREDDRAAYDDRGAIYIRLGAPARAVAVTLNRMKYATRFLEFMHLLTGFPENTFWVYPAVGYEAQYLFIRNKGRGYVLGEPYDLIPAGLQNGMTASERGTRKAELLLRLMEDIYGRLALHHQHYANRYDGIAAYVEQLEEVAYQQEASQLSTAMQTIDQQQGRAEGEDVKAPMTSAPLFDVDRQREARLGLPPSSYALATLMQAKMEDEQAARQREARVPPAYSDVYRQEEPLPVALRWARFLDPDGTTRTELYWTLAAADLVPSRALEKRLEKAGQEPLDAYLLQLAAVQRAVDYRSRIVNLQHYLVAREARPPGATLPTQSFVARGDTGTFHLALQWSEHWAERAGPDKKKLNTGALLKVGALRIDSLAALGSDEGRLEMSDLKPLLLNEAAADEDALTAATPYPYAGLMHGTPVALYFELYHLTFAADDQVHYTVAYEVARSRNKGGLLRLLGGRKTEQTSARTRHTGSSRTAKEYVLLDLEDWEGQGELEVTVRVTDETTGQEQARRIRFDLVAANRKPDAG